MTEKELVISSKFSITSADTDINARLRPGALVNWLIQMAIRSADSMGFGFEELKKQDLFWVLSSLTLEIERPLMWYDEAEIITWPKNVHNLMYVRDFLIKEPRGDIIGRATSGWFAIDLARHRPRKVEGDHSEIFDILRDRHAMERLPEKLLPAGEGNSRDLFTTYYDIDLNRHVTSVRYIDWMMDSVPLDVLLSASPKRLTINYLKEIGINETVRVTTRPGQDGIYHFEGMKTASGSVAFRGRIGF